VLTPTMSGCMSLATTRDDVDALVAAFESVIAG
jgi:hypothetical protein